MPNVSLTRRCNRACAFCFASSAPAGGADLDEAGFAEALDLIGEAVIPDACVLGGEPSLHPRFGDFCELAFKRGFAVRVFTNGLGPEASYRRLAEIPEGRVRVLVNLSPSDTSRRSEERRQEVALRILGARAMPAVTIDRPEFDFSFIPDLIERFGLERRIRIGIAHPSIGAQTRYLEPRHYARVGSALLAFSDRARRIGAELMFDCGFVPCMFPPGSLAELGPGARRIGTNCGSIPDLLPDGSAVPCFPLAPVASARWRGRPEGSEKRLRAIMAEHEAVLAPYRAIGIFRDCGACARRASGACNGGCLAHAMGRLKEKAWSNVVRVIS